MTDINVEVKDGVTVLTYPEGDKEAEQVATKTLLQKMREIYEGDELMQPILNHDYLDGMVINHEPYDREPKVLSASTPSGRPSVVDQIMDAQQKGSHFEKIELDSISPLPVVCVGDYKPYPHQKAAMERIQKHWYEQGYRAALSGKPTLHLLDVGRRIEELKAGAVPLVLCDERHPLDPKESHEKLMRMLESHARMSVPKGMGKLGSLGGRSVFFLDSYVPGLGAPDYSGLSAYAEFEYKYAHAAARSKTTDHDKRHEEICKVLLQPHKKRRKAFRKMLDQIGGNLKHEQQRNAEGNASDNV